jgi:excisionase family DNA binding protein
MTLSESDRAVQISCFLTPPAIAMLLRVSPDKILGWIRRGQIKAINVGNGVRPRYRVSPQSLDDFLASREFKPPSPRVRRRPEPPEGGPIDPVLGQVLLKKKQAVKIGNEYYRVWNGMTLFY